MIQELKPGLVVDYTLRDGRVSPATVAEVLDYTTKAVRLAVPPDVQDHPIPLVPFSDSLRPGAWSFPPVVKSKNLPVINPHQTKLKSTHWFSATQLKSWQACNAQWGFKHLDKIKGQNRFAARGDQMHGFLHGWLAHGIPPPEDVREAKLARAGMKFLPLPGTAVVEQRVNIVSRGGYMYNLAIDFEHDEEYMGRTIHVIGDHKSTTDFKWAMNPETLSRDIAGLIYAARGLSNTSLSEVLLRWLYYKDNKTRPSCRSVETRLTRTEVETKFEAIDAIAFDISVNGLTKKSGVELPRNAESCGAYGGCTYRDICPVTNSERLRAIMTQSSLRDRLLTGVPNGAAKAAETIPATTTAAAAASVAPKAGEAAPAASNALSRLRAATAAQAATPNPLTSAQTRHGPPFAPQTGLPDAPLQRTAAAPQPSTPAAPVAQQSASPGPMSSMAARLAQRTKDAEVLSAGIARAEADVQRAAAMRAATQPAGTVLPEAGTWPSGEVPDPPSTFDTISEHQPYDINPPEAPENPISDPDELSAANQLISPSKRGRPAGSKNSPKTTPVVQAPPVVVQANVSPTGISNEAYIFAQVYGRVMEAVFRDPTTFSDVVIGDEAGLAVRAFRDLMKGLEGE